MSQIKSHNLSSVDTIAVTIAVINNLIISLHANKILPDAEIKKILKSSADQLRQQSVSTKAAIDYLDGLCDHLKL